MPDAIRQTLDAAAGGLLYPSDIDAPFESFFWADEKPSSLSPQEVTRLAGISPDTPIKTAKLDTFFHRVTKQEEWHNKLEKAQVKSFENLLATIKTLLRNVKVYRVGETTFDVYIVGAVEDGYAGIKTKIVET